MNSVPIDGFRNLDAREAPHSHDKDLLAKWIGWSVLAPKVEKILTKAQRSGKILAMGGAPQQAAHCRQLGALSFFVGVDVSLKHKMFAEALSGFREVTG